MACARSPISQNRASIHVIGRIPGRTWLGLRIVRQFLDLSPTPGKIEGTCDIRNGRRRCKLAPKLETPKSSDPLASLRIDRTQAERSRPRWGSRLAIVLLLGVAIGAGVYVWIVHAGDLLRPDVKTAVAEVRVPGVSDSVLAAQGYIK